MQCWLAVGQHHITIQQHPGAKKSSRLAQRNNCTHAATTPWPVDLFLKHMVIVWSWWAFR